MKHKDNIEELFSESFENFEPEVDPSAWSNIQENMGSSGSGSSSGGPSTGSGFLGSKTALIAGVAVVSTAAGLIIGSQFIGNNNSSTQNSSKNLQEQTTTPDEGQNQENLELNSTSVQELKNEFIEREKKQQETKGSDLSNTMSSDDNGEKFHIREGELSEGEHYGSSAAYGLAQSSNYDPASDQDSDENNNESADKGEDKEIEIVRVEEDKPYVSITASPVGGYAPLHVSFMSDANYDNLNWDFGDGETSTEENPVHVYYEIGTYEVTVEVVSPEGQTSTDKIFVEVKPSSSIEIPNVFTPNNDGKNDKFFVVGNKIRNFNMKVFSRDGKLLFESTDQSMGWDGTDLQGKEVPAATYFYIITAEGDDGKEFKEKGHVSLFR